MSVTRTSLVNRLRTQLDALPAALGTADEPRLRRQPAPGQWSAFEQIAHLARHQALFLGRIRQILDEHEPAMPSYRAELDDEWAEWRQRDLAGIVERLRADRQRLAEMVEALSDEQLARVGVHAVLGAMPLDAWLEFFLAHAGHHLYVAFRRARGGV
jgi:hypothetical protein